MKINKSVENHHRGSSESVESESRESRQMQATKLLILHHSCLHLQIMFQVKSKIRIEMIKNFILLRFEKRICFKPNSLNQIRAWRILKLQIIWWILKSCSQDLGIVLKFKILKNDDGKKFKKMKFYLRCKNKDNAYKKKLS